MGELLLKAQNRRPVQRTRARRKAWTKTRRERFLSVLAASCNVKLAADAAGMSSSTAYQLRKRDRAFAVLWQEALVLGYETLEAALLAEAIRGVNAIAIEPAGDVDPLGPIRLDPVEAGDAAGDGAGDAAGDGGDGEPMAIVPGSGMVAGPPTLGRLQFALAMLNRHRAAVTGDGQRIKGKRHPTSDEVDTMLREKLDILARQRANQA